MPEQQPFTEADGEIIKLKTQMENVVLAVTRMEQKMDTWGQNFVSKELLEERSKAMYKEIEQIKEEQHRLDKEKAEKDDLDRLEKEKTTKQTMTPSWALVLVTVITLIITLWHK